MKRNPNYIKTIIDGSVTLVPFASEITDYRPSVTLNETADYLWEQLKSETTAESLRQEFTARYGPETGNDLDEIISLWAATGLILRSPAEITAAPIGRSFRIAGINITISGNPKLIPAALEPYSIEGVTPDLKIALLPGFPASYDAGQVLIANSTALITESDNSYRMLYYDLKTVRDCFLAKDGRSAVIYYRSSDRDGICDEIMQVLRVFFSLSALNKGLLFLHSASILYGNKLWLFSASSGGGKSSHVKLWLERGAAEAINGDLNLIDATTLKVYGTPWCGTSGITSTETYELGGICMLKKATVNSIVSSSTEAAGLKIMNRTVSPTWNRETAAKSLELSARIGNTIPLWRLACDLSEDAYITSKTHIDSLLKLS